MILIPIGHEQDTVRRLPWVTFVILAICFVVQIFTWVAVKGANSELEPVAQEFVSYYISHPYLEFDPELRDILFNGVDDEQVDQLLSYYSTTATRPSARVQEEEQQHLDQLAQAFLGSLNETPYRKWGYIPAKPSLLTAFTYMFVHGGWLHLLGNLLFLYLTGPFIEDLWGRPVFAAFYLAVGVLSAVAFGAHYPESTGPLVGASGAIAGVMGAFLVKYWKIKINFFYWILIFFRGTFQAPAWLMLPLWLGLELFNARIMDSLNPESGGGVAHWAHVWGFVLGLTIALGINLFKIEERFISPRLQTKLIEGEGGFDIVAHAIRQKNLGMLRNAYDVLLEEAHRNPTNGEVVETLWEFGHEMGQPDEASIFFIKLIEKEIRQDQLDSALAHFVDLRQRMPGASLGPMYQLALIKHLTEVNDVERAKELASELIPQLEENVPATALQNFTAVAKRLSPSLAATVIELCLRHPEIPSYEKEALQQELQGLVPGPA
jgi:membrane associated rhomboid family serine protease